VLRGVSRGRAAGARAAGEETLVVAEVEDRWYSPGETFFRVRVANGDRYVLRHLEAQDTWSLEAFRSGAN